MVRFLSFFLSFFNNNIYLGKVKRALLFTKNNHDNNQQQQQEFESLIKSRTDHFEIIHRHLDTVYDMWLENLEKYRYENRLLKLFSNRQIMIMIILFTTSISQDSIQRKFLNKLFPSKSNTIDENQHQLNLIILCLIHYLRAIRINDCDLSLENITVLYQKYKFESGTSIDISLKQLCGFLKELFNNGKELMTKTSISNENQQFLITLNLLESNSDKQKLENDFNMETYGILLDIFNDRIPSAYQILWCSISTEDDIRLFFLRIRTFPSLTFAIMDIDKMHHRLRELLLDEQNLLTKETKSHGSVYYFSRELLTCRKGLQPYIILPKHRNSQQMYTQLILSLRKNNIKLPEIQIICGAAGIGKFSFLLCIFFNSFI